MDIAGPAPFAEVRETFLQDHPLEGAHEANSNQDGEQNLERAEQLLGTWWRVRLSRAEVLGVILPWHLSEGGRLELVPRSGLTVAQAAERIRSGGAEWAEANPVCAAKLRLLRHAPFTPVYLSTRPVPHSDYSDLRIREGLIHLDGLHRMLAWELAERLPAEERLDAFIASDLPIRPATGSGSDAGRRTGRDEHARPATVRGADTTAPPAPPRKQRA
ncbi:MULTISPECIES: DUF6309 family protein [Kitasatospora]|uniref:ParB/Sulfiredoxin domain-containing protein n=1 Tax=Kitasatospora cystarginea TaxID=58350 RepID=A0ABN3E4S5_9ACTN